MQATMDPHPGTFPVLSYVMSRLPSFGPRTPTSASASASSASASTSHSASTSGSHHVDIEQPPHSDASSSSIVGQMPNLANPEMLASMTRAISDVAQARSVFKVMGPRPTHEEVDEAKAKLADLEAHLSRQLEEIVGLPRPPEIDEARWTSHIAEKEKVIKESTEKEKRILKSIIQLDNMHDAYGKLLKDAEKRLVKIYENDGIDYDNNNENDEDDEDSVQVKEQVEGILKEAYGKGVERIALSGKRLKYLPEAFGHIPASVVLDVSSNQLSVIPDSICGLESLEELNLSSNALESLPESIGLLQKLKVLNVSGNKLSALPDSISKCSSLVELDASFNSLSYLPTNIGFELRNLQKLMIQLNKIRSLPSSICEMKSLRYLDAHFNELRGLPVAIGKLTNLQVLNLSSNFSDLKELPETFGDLINLRELDLSNNQIHALPDSFGRLHNLTKLNLEQNPVEVPPMHVVDEGLQAIKGFMSQRWIDILEEEEKKTTQEVQEQGENGWLTRSTSWLKNVSENVSEMIMSPKSPKEAYLNQQL
ncbi:plant intracellular Ras-group-related LRR protein 9-like [Vigna radiata var. radiata]|uniref:Plant intracellular Ras-group-related LRR protein 9-like n=1 Tax=Vigna radiata var. radiata TaxID=3916 RepID=A0A1S3T9X5_VIGRR|nr:plant intracellular Ras-group-related LRR protein 9-like [Vigna radiata var. radiata]